MEHGRYGVKHGLTYRGGCLAMVPLVPPPGGGGRLDGAGWGGQGVAQPLGPRRAPGGGRTRGTGHVGVSSRCQTACHRDEPGWGIRTGSARGVRDSAPHTGSPKHGS